MRITRILGDRVLVSFPSTVTDDSPIYIPEAHRKQPAIGTVVMLGTGKKIPEELKVGDRIRVDTGFGSFACMHEDKPHRIVSVLDCQFILPDGLSVKAKPTLLRNPRDLPPTEGFAHRKELVKT